MIKRPTSAPSQALSLGRRWLMMQSPMFAFAASSKQVAWAALSATALPTLAQQVEPSLAKELRIGASHRMR